MIAVAHNREPVMFLEVRMPDEWSEENVFGEADGSSYSAVLARTQEGKFTVHRLLIDGHNVAVTDGPWPSRDEAVQ
jgi:hypothetical protein